MAKSPDAFRTISEVADWLGIQAHVLRFWESKFTQVKPVKRAGGRRYYRPADMMLLGGIKKLLHDDGMTIKGVQKIIQTQGVGAVSELSQSIDESTLSIEVEAEEISATVLPFQGGAGIDPITKDPVTEPEPSVEIKDSTQDDVQTDAVDDDQTDPIPEPEESAEKPLELEATAAEDPPEPPVLPSFLSRVYSEEIDANLAKPAPTAPQPEIARAVVVDVADPGPDDSQTYNPGPLGQLAGLDYLTAAQAHEIAPLAEELRAWLVRTDAA